MDTNKTNFTLWDIAIILFGLKVSKIIDIPWIVVFIPIIIAILSIILWIFFVLP